MRKSIVLFVCFLCANIGIAAAVSAAVSQAKAYSTSYTQQATNLKACIANVRCDFSTFSASKM